MYVFYFFLIVYKIKQIYDKKTRVICDFFYALKGRKFCTVVFVNKQTLCIVRCTVCVLYYTQCLFLTMHSVCFLLCTDCVSYYAQTVFLTVHNIQFYLNIQIHFVNLFSFTFMTKRLILHLITQLNFL